MKITATELPGVVVVEPRVFADERGFFLETYHERRYDEAGLSVRFVQHNFSHSVASTLRGLHYQLRQPQGKLVRCVRGAVFDVAADIRRGSPTFGRWVGVELTADNHRQLYIPPGFAHGFAALTEANDIEYACTDFYRADDECGVIWNDPLLAISWPITNPLLSGKDAKFTSLSTDRDDLPVWKESPG